MAPLEDIAIEPAVLETIKRYIKDKDGNVIEEVENTTPLLLNEDTTPCTINVRFETALDHRGQHSDFENLNIVLASTFVFGYVKQSQITTREDLREKVQNARRVTVFLCGGPGDQNPSDRNEMFNKEYLRDNGCLIFLNYRGTGSFSEICYKIKSSNESKPAQQRYVDLVKSKREERRSALAEVQLNDKGQLIGQDANNMANLLELFRQDSIVFDLESIRQCIGKDKWHIFGQSYGGWISLTYLSLFPGSLESSTITAGLAPITVSCDDAYIKLFEVVKNRNDRYYGKYPGDIKKVKDIVRALLKHSQGIKIDDGHLTARRFLCIGRALGARDRFPDLHDLLEEMHKGITNIDDPEIEDPEIEISPATEKMFLKQDSWGFDRRPLYAVLHEAMYTRRAATNWSAKSVASEFPEFEWAAADEEDQPSILEDICQEKDNRHKIYFSGEMVYPFMFKDYDALAPLKNVAEKLAQHVWTDPYNNDVLLSNTVPVDALSYPSDMHVNRNLSDATAALVNNIRHGILNMVPDPNPMNKGKEVESQHASLRTDTVAVFKALKNLPTSSKK